MTKILIGAIHWAVASGRYMADAFRRMGCDVRTAGPAMGIEIWGMQINPKYIWTPDYTTAPGIVADYGIKPMLAGLGGWTPDLIINMDSAFSLMGDRGYFPCPKVLYGVDNHVRSYDRPGEWYDHYFLAHSQGPALIVCEGCSKFTWLPCGYDPVTFTPSPILMTERIYDVALVGYPYPDRMKIVDTMRAAGLMVYAGLGPLYEDYRDIYHQARISLCLSANQDLAQRIFETAAMGCMVLSDPVPDLPKLGAVEYQHYVPYHSVSEAVELAKDYLSEPQSDLFAVANAGQSWAKSHTWDARARTILETMELS